MPDIVIETPPARLHFRDLEWDTEYFGLPSYMLDAERSVLQESPALGQAIPAALQGTFSAARIDAAADPQVFMMFYRSGFYSVDTEITLRYVPEPSVVKPRTTGVHVEEFKKNEGLPYEKLGGVFSFTRFHYDPNIGKARADRLWVEYIRNFQPSAEARLFVARCDERVAGCFTVLAKGSFHVISFVAVLDEFKGRSVGAALVSAVVANCGAAGLLTETQARNVSALNFYIRNGFRRIDKTSMVMHRWDK